jgi:hypothetical protein
MLSRPDSVAVEEIVEGERSLVPALALFVLVIERERHLAV